MAGWQLVKFTSTYYFVSAFWRGVGRSFKDTIKKCIYGGLVHFAGRGVGKYLHVCRRQPILFVNACRFLFRDSV